MLEKKFKEILGSRFTKNDSVRANFARGEDAFDPILPSGVAFPNNNQEISKIVKICNEHSIPIVPFGTGTSLEGNVVGNNNGIAISLENMNKILSIDEKNFQATVETGLIKSGDLFSFCFFFYKLGSTR